MGLWWVFALCAGAAVSGAALAQRASQPPSPGTATDAGQVAVHHLTRRRIAFNDGWRFIRGDVANGETPELNDDQWQDVRLPHDWAIEGPFDPSLNPHTGGLPVAGVGWYRKAFTIATRGAQRYADRSHHVR